MELNIGSTERLVRVLIGLLLGALGVFHVLTGAAAIAGYIVGAVALVTGLVRFCPPGSCTASIPTVRKRHNKPGLASRSPNMRCAFQYLACSCFRGR